MWVVQISLTSGIHLEIADQLNEQGWGQLTFTLIFHFPFVEINPTGRPGQFATTRRTTTRRTTTRRTMTTSPTTTTITPAPSLQSLSQLFKSLSKFSKLPKVPKICFPSTAKVKLVNGKLVTMSELQIGDKVQIGMSTLFIIFFCRQKFWYWKIVPQCK